MAALTAAIMQPTYLPYLGYFHLIAASDVFVFLDDVQFARRSWQSRNRILGPGGEVMLTVPVKKHERDTPISKIEICEGEAWRNRHLKAISLNYARRPAFAEGFAFLEQALATTGLLADLHRTIIEGAACKIGLTTRFVNARDLDCPGHRSDHLLAICKAVGATDYLSPMGSHDYMQDDGVFAAAGFPVRFQGFVNIPYPQGREPFEPYMAFVDALMNLGWAGLAQLIARMREESSSPS